MTGAAMSGAAVSPARSAVVYHGTLLPRRAWSIEQTGDVVLQPYHAIVKYGGFESWFPKARRFVYINPTAVDRLRRTDVTDDMVRLDPDDRWGLPRLHLPEQLDWAVADAAMLAGLPGVHGVFVDDVDLLEGSQADIAVEYVRRVTASTGCTAFVNRGFGLVDALARVAPVEAVLLEDLDRDAASPGSTRWAQRVVVPALVRARAAGTRVHRLEYGAAPAADPSLGRQVEPLLDSCARMPDPVLDQWSWWDDPAAAA